jgi:hypothetical protein
MVYFRTILLENIRTEIEFVKGIDRIERNILNSSEVRKEGDDIRVLNTMRMMVLIDIGIV